MSEINKGLDSLSFNDKNNPFKDIDLYTQVSSQTAKDSIKDNLSYMINGLTSEAGEVAGVFKKAQRDNFGELTEEIRLKLIKEVGDVAWYFSQICRVLNVPASQVLEMNVNKLQDRKERNVISGSGDNR